MARDETGSAVKTDTNIDLTHAVRQYMAKAIAGYEELVVEIQRDGKMRLVFPDNVIDANANQLQIKASRISLDRHGNVMIVKLSSHAAFAPVMELVIPLDGATVGMFFIDFETGKIITPPPAMPLRNETVGYAWMVEQGVDANAQEKTTGQKLWGRGSVFTEVVPEHWDTITAEQVIRAIGIGHLNGQATVRSPDAVPATFLFKTREGGMGVLQIVGFTDEADGPRGVDIRYKMVKKTGKTKADPPAEQVEHDIQGAVAMMEPLKATFARAYFALMENNDTQTALKMLDDLMPQLEKWQAMFKDTPQQHTAEGAVQLLAMVHKALQEGDSERAMALMKGLDAVGANIEKQLQQGAVE
jgi:hypothetical protein